MLLKNSKSKRNHKIKKVWHNESLILNTKTNIVHYPSEKLFTYYNQISNKHLSVIKFDDWESQVLPPKHFIKGKSGIIIERLALNKLTSPITDDKLNAAIITLGTAFSADYYEHNSNNWRLYELLIQLIALNSSVKVELKWNQFFEAVKKIDFHLLKVPQRNNWIKSREEFDKRVEYIRYNHGTYLKRLENRIG